MSKSKKNYHNLLELHVFVLRMKFDRDEKKFVSENYEPDLSLNVNKNKVNLR